MKKIMRMILSIIEIEIKINIFSMMKKEEYDFIMDRYNIINIYEFK